MAQQPTISETTPLALSPATRVPSWTPTRPGEITSPEQAVGGPGFGAQGPDTGYAYRLIKAAEFDRCGRGKILEEVVVNIMGARAGAIGRAPTSSDLEVALAVLGVGNVKSEAKKRLSSILDHTAHEVRRGMSFVNDLPSSVLVGTVSDATSYATSEIS